MRILEVCADSIQSVRAAVAGGASRVELCSGLAEGGMTPSVGLLKTVLSLFDIKVHVLIRPRPGDFVYDGAEQASMLADITACREAGAHGVVIGALKLDGQIDMAVCRRLVDAAGDMSLTFHRAIDLCRDPFEALDMIAGLGCQRVLTSGLAASAESGIGTLRRMHQYAAGRVLILAGGGVTPANARRIIDEGMADELHSSARSTFPSSMQYRRHDIAMGAGGADEYSRKITDAAIVRGIIEQMN